MAHLPSNVIDGIDYICSKSEEFYPEDRDEWRRLRQKGKTMISEEGFKHIDTGTYRIVYKFPRENKVLKIAQSRDGRVENKSAFENWRDAKNNEVRRVLARLYDYDIHNSYWLVQEYIPEMGASDEDVQHIKNILKKHNHNIREVDKFNVGLRANGTPALLDYGGK